MIKVPDNFGGLEKEFSIYENSKFAVLPVPYAGTVTYGKGTENGPRAIIEASKNMELYDEELSTSPCTAGICTLKELKAVKDPKKTVELVYAEVKKILKDGKFPIVLGGEHSLSIGCVKAAKEHYKNSEFCVLHFDAHSDLRDEYDGSKHSHACAMRRISEFSDFVSVGIRSMSEEEGQLIKGKKFRIFYAKDLVADRLLYEKILEVLPQNLYITIDLDVFDPSIMPATGTPEPGGLGWYEVVNFLKKISIFKNIVGLDVVELAPQKNNNAPDFLAAKLIYKVIGFVSNK